MLLAPGLVHEAQARNTALVVFMLPPLPVANAITIGSRFFLSFIGFSLFRYVGIRFFGILVSWFFGISVYAASHADRDGKRSEEAALDQALRHGFGREEQRIVVRVFAARALAAFGPSPVVAAITAHAFTPVRMFGQPVTDPTLWDPVQAPSAMWRSRAISRARVQRLA